MVTNEELEARVERGAALLDKHKPGWWQDVNLNAVTSIQNASCCILCEVFGKYERGLIALQPASPCGRLEGFAAFDSEDIPTVAAWKRLILARRAAHVTLPPKPLLAKCVSLVLAK